MHFSELTQKNNVRHVHGIYLDPFTNYLWVVTGDNRYEEVYENFEKSVQRLPKKDVDSFLRDRILSFIKSL